MTRVDEQSIALDMLRHDHDGYIDDALRRLFERFEGLAIVVVEVAARPDPLGALGAPVPTVRIAAYSDFTADHPLRTIVARMVRKAAAEA